jgi:hypothetical protein
MMLHLIIPPAVTCQRCALLVTIISNTRFLFQSASSSVICRHGVPLRTGEACAEVHVISRLSRLENINLLVAPIYPIDSNLAMYIEANSPGDI